MNTISHLTTRDFRLISEMCFSIHVITNMDFVNSWHLKAHKHNHTALLLWRSYWNLGKVTSVRLKVTKNVLVVDCLKNGDDRQILSHYLHILRNEDCNITIWQTNSNLWMTNKLITLDKCTKSVEGSYWVNIYLIWST